MYTNNRLHMYAMKTSKGAVTEFCFLNATSVDRCNGWNHWAQHKFQISYAHGRPYAIIDGEEEGEYLYYELSKVKWYTVKELVDICKQKA